MAGAARASGCGCEGSAASRGLSWRSRAAVLCPFGQRGFAGAFEGASVEPIFLPHSSRDAFLVALCREKPRVVVGESSFLRVALEDAKKLGIWEAIPEGVHLLCAGTPLDMELLPLAEECDIGVHDLYGCQEFGWLVMDGAPLRDDRPILVPDAEREGWAILVAGGLPTGDSFPMGGAGHVLNADGPIHTYARQRTTPELEVVVRACTAQSEMTLERACRSILRIKGRIVRPAPGARIAAETNELALVEAWPSGRSVAVVGDQERDAAIRLPAGGSRAVPSHCEERPALDERTLSHA